MAARRTLRTSGYVCFGFVLGIVGCGGQHESANEKLQPRAATPVGGSRDGRTVASHDGGSHDGGTGPAVSVDAVKTELVSGDVTIVGLTSDGWAVFRDGDALRAAHLSSPFETTDVAAKAGSVVIRGKVLFNWANVDWMANVGDLSIWSADGGAHPIGSTQFAEGLVAASDAGDAIAYTTNLTDTTMDVVLAPSDLSASQVVMKSVGRGSNTTCTPTIGFVGARFFAGSCAAGERSGSIQRFERGREGWQSTVVSTGALPVWSADAAGDKVFFQSDSYAGEYVDGGQAHVVDNGAGTGVILPDGSAILYTVGDQLRRTALPNVNPITIVTTGYSNPVAFSPSFRLALYSTKVTYDASTKRDLRITPTDAFNPTPTELVAEPLASLPRSYMTSDEKLVLYLTDPAPTGANLHLVTVAGKERAVLPGVIEAAAARAGAIVFTDDSSDPSHYPVLADLKFVDPNAGGAPELLEATVVDGKSFQVDASGTHVVYVRSAIVGDAGTARMGGLMVLTLP